MQRTPWRRIVVALILFLSVVKLAAADDSPATVPVDQPARATSPPPLIVELEVWIVQSTTSEDQAPLPAMLDRARFVEHLTQLDSNQQLDRLRHLSTAVMTGRSTSLAFQTRTPLVRDVNTTARGRQTSISFLETGCRLEVETRLAPPESIECELVLEESHLEQSNVVISESPDGDKLNAEETPTIVLKTTTCCPPGKVVQLSGMQIDAPGESSSLAIYIAAKVIE
ncbi:hypothetical protein [Aeoliella mucimassa]|uniref:Bacterial type II and III secretion system protein n=1 Tax=Aeoliella mucimassa TaxID=2527972 RepID=A0A518AKJ1_9BACT|nr:hypothetical protein [Aeoliella mucimassa]QDU55216.1 hypothetical protein Pan181_14020 [Aeoliella mucimassa]